jgi:hypothetical protein
MDAKTSRVALLPKFSSFVGNLSFEGDPIVVIGFDKAEFAFWRGPVAASGTFQLKLEGSTDGLVWTSIHVADPGLNSEAVYVLGTITYPLLRCVVTLAGTASVGVTCWVLATLIRRKAPQGARQVSGRTLGRDAAATAGRPRR